jgi:hypothetical protein
MWISLRRPRVGSSSAKTARARRTSEAIHYLQLTFVRGARDADVVRFEPGVPHRAQVDTAEPVKISTGSSGLAPEGARLDAMGARALSRRAPRAAVGDVRTDDFARHGLARRATTFSTWRWR